MLHYYKFKDITKNPLLQIQHELEKRGPLLLILDNVEQVVGDVYLILQSLLHNTTQTRILTTSRIKIGLQDEQIVPLEPLSLLAGIELFVQKAQQSRPDFVLTEENRELIAQIVLEVDLLPLAIELAAARIAMLNLEQIHDRLSERFTLLRGRIRDPHQQALLP